MKVGVKIYTRNHGLVPQYVEHSDFIEVLIEPDKEYKMLKEYDVKYVIHAPHQNFGFNPADRNSWDKSKKILGNTIEAADFLDARKIIVHAGTGDNLERENAFIEFMQDCNDKRILLENLPKSTKYYPYFFSTPEEVKKVSEKLGFGICLDFAHAVCTAATLKTNAIKLIEGINALKPRHYHFSDGWLASETDSELHLFKGDYPLEEFKKMIPEDGEVTIETPHGIGEKIKEIEFLRR